MKVRKKTTVSVETERILTIRRRRLEIDGWCEGCGGQVKLVMPETASAMTGLSVRAICHLVDAGKLHFIETPNGLLTICLNSLIQESKRSTHCEQEERKGEIRK